MTEDQGAELPATAEAQPRVFIWRRWEQLKGNLERCLSYIDEMYLCYKKNNKEEFAKWCLMIYAILKEVYDRLDDLKGWG